MNINQNLKNEIYFVIPAYNEGMELIKVLDNLHENGFSNLIVIDDGSTDSSALNITSLNTKINNLVLLEHVINRGQGAALKTGIDFALDCDDCKYIVTFDSDGQHRLSDLHHFITELEIGTCDIAIGSRFINPESKKNIPFKKKILLKGALFVTYYLSRNWFTDTHNGYRVMNKTAARKINISLDRFEHASEILNEVVVNKIPYKEVPVIIDYTEYSIAKGQKISNAIKILVKMIFKTN
ncbi:MAG: glycosyltransferase family 2 protein [Nanoarchaeales archaeon]|nr:glycosyltransferase family 2 protein [Nanoarchaeales archaeon]